MGLDVGIEGRPVPEDDLRQVGPAPRIGLPVGGLVAVEAVAAAMAIVADGADLLPST